MLMNTAHQCQLLYEDAILGGDREQRERILERLTDFFSASAGMWRRGWAGDAVPSSLTLCGAPRQLPSVFRRNEGLLSCYAVARERAGHIVTLAPTTEQGVGPSAAVQLRLLKPLGIGSLAVLYLPEGGGLWNEFTLMAALDDPPLCESELAPLLDLAPAAVGAARVATFVGLARPSEPGWQRPSALVDLLGRIHDAQLAFVELLDQHYDDFNGHDLPFPVPEADGKTVLSPAPLTMEASFDGEMILLRLERRHKLSGLSDREREISEGIADGKSYKRLAADLGISPSTVSNHLQRIYTKLEVNTRESLAEVVKGAMPQAVRDRRRTVVSRRRRSAQ